MPRYAAKVTREFLEEKIREAWSKLEGDDRYLWLRLTPEIKDDLKVSFDAENLYAENGEGHHGTKNLVGYHTLDNLTFLGIVSGGDWEMPVFWIVYWDGKKLRAYVPTEGNPYNQTMMQAYGNDSESDVLDWNDHHEEQIGEDDDLPWNGWDPGLIVQDIKERIKVR